MAFKRFLTLSAACIILAAAQPVDKLPVLRDTHFEVLFKDGEKAVLDCIIEGGNNVKYSWQKNGSPITLSSNTIQRKDEGTLEFQSPTASDEGLYICTAVTSHGTATTRGTWFKRAYINIPKVTVQKHKAVEGRPFKLDCALPEGYPKPTVAWKTQLDGSDKVEDFLNQRITASPDGPLWFSNVTQEDANPKSKYICVAKSSAFEEVRLAEHYINEIEADSTPNNGDLVPQYLSKDLVTKVGEDSMIWCIYGGTPLARPDWFKDGKNTNGDEPGSRVTRHNRSSGRRLLIRDTRLGDTGVYKCVASNERGKPQEHSMKLTVVNPPTFTKKPEKQTLAKEGQDITIPCVSIGEPSPTQVFTFNGQDLKTSDRISTSAEGITIKKLQKSDTGYYGCRIVNKYGNDYKETLVNVA